MSHDYFMAHGSHDNTHSLREDISQVIKGKWCVVYGLIIYVLFDISSQVAVCLFE